VVEPIVVDAKLRLDDETARIVVAANPVPVTATVCVPPPSKTFSVPLRAPVVVGRKLMVTVQAAPAASDPPSGQVVDSANELAPVPENETLVKLAAAEPVFVTVTTPVVALVVFTTVAGKA
jgi:hypothetical protein